MKKLKQIKESDLAFKVEMVDCYCDFCGEDNVMVFTSSFDDRKDGDLRKCEMQICVDCVEQLNKFNKS
jgi:hypothetical protein